MLNIETSTDGELIPYLEHFEEILGSTTDALAMALRAYFITTCAEVSPTQEKFQSLLSEELWRVQECMNDRGHDGEDEKEIFSFDLTDIFEELFQILTETLQKKPEEIMHVGILSLSAIEDILEQESDVLFCVQGENVPLRRFFEEGMPQPTLQ